MKKILFVITATLMVLLSPCVNAASRPAKAKAGVVKTKADRSAKKMYSMDELTRNLEYDFGRASIRDGYYDKLDQLAKTMIDKKYAVALRGYADSIGTFKGNWVISDKRAKAVKSYLVTKGVDGSKIVTTPFGSTKPIASNKTKLGRQKNRRVEIKLNEVAD
jgi:OOP family OmpA-OmpF porin